MSDSHFTRGAFEACLRVRTGQSGRSTRLLRENVPETLGVRPHLLKLQIRQRNESVSNLSAGWKSALQFLPLGACVEAGHFQEGPSLGLKNVQIIQDVVTIGRDSMFHRQIDLTVSSHAMALCQEWRRPKGRPGLSSGASRSQLLGTIEMTMRERISVPTCPGRR